MEIEVKVFVLLLASKEIDSMLQAVQNKLLGKFQKPVRFRRRDGVFTSFILQIKKPNRIPTQRFRGKVSCKYYNSFFKSSRDGGSSSVLSKSVSSILEASAECSSLFHNEF